MPSDRFVDPYLERTGILRNLVGATTQQELLRREYPLTSLERHPIQGNFDAFHIAAIHQTLFQDVYPWAGQFRTVNISKGSTNFLPAQRLEIAFSYLADSLQNSGLLTPDLTDDEFIRAISHLLSEVNYIHPFRDGNGRTQRAYLDQVAQISNRTLSWRNISMQDHLLASIDSVFAGTGEPFEPLFREIIKPPKDGLSIFDSGLYDITEHRPADNTNSESRYFDKFMEVNY